MKGVDTKNQKLTISRDVFGDGSVVVESTPKLFKSGAAIGEISIRIGDVLAMYPRTAYYSIRPFVIICFGPKKLATKRK